MTPEQVRDANARAEVLSAALAYARRGWPVFPCSPATGKGGKRPMVPGADKDEHGNEIPRTGGLWRASTDEAVIRSWWRVRPRALIGVPTGKKIGAFVVDFDPKDGESADDVEARLVAAVGPLPAGPRGRTQSGGRHLWFALPDGEELKNSVRRIPGVDWRAEGGYVIVPPSVMENGATYVWEVSPDDVPLPAPPSALLDLVCQRGAFAPHGHDLKHDSAPARPAPAAPMSSDLASIERVRKYVLAALDAEAQAVRTCGSGSRNATLNIAALKLGQLVGAGVLAEGIVIATLEDAAAACGLVKDDGLKSVRDTIASGLKKGRSDPRDLREVARAAARRGPPRAPFPTEDDGTAPWMGAPEAPLAPSVGLPPAESPEPPVGPPSRGEADLDAAVAECAELEQSDTDNARRLLRHFGENLVVRRQEGGRNAIWVCWCGTHWDDQAGSAGATRYAQQVGPRIALEADFLTATAAERKAIEDAGQASVDLAALEAGALASKAPKDFWTVERKADKERLLGAIEVGQEAKDALKARRIGRRKFAVSSKNAARIEAMLKMAAPHILVDPAAFNADPFKVATPQETLVFRREPDPECPDPEQRRWQAVLDIVPGHRRGDLITPILPVAYDAEAIAPRWSSFVERFLPDPTVRRFVQVLTGLGLLGVTEQKMVFHYGSGANGKSVFLEVVSRVLGPLAVSLPAESISGENYRAGAGASPDIARLFGARFVRVAEMPEGTPLQEDLVKKLTGGERFPVRNLFEGFFEFDPVFIAHMSGNGYPKINGTDNGIWRRMAVVKWPVTLADEEQRNFHDVVEEFAPEHPGILNWLIEGAKVYLAEGLVRPEAVAAETQKYRDEMDPVGRFFGSCVNATGNETDQVRGAELYRAYTAWSEASGLRPVSGTRFGRDAAKRARRVDGEVRKYLGIVLHDVPAAPRSPGGDGGEAQDTPAPW